MTEDGFVLKCKYLILNGDHSAILTITGRGLHPGKIRIDRYGSATDNEKGFIKMIKLFHY
jgi:hypothetical protein